MEEDIVIEKLDIQYQNLGYEEIHKVEHQEKKQRTQKDNCNEIQENSVCDTNFRNLGYEEKRNSEKNEFINNVLKDTSEETKHNPEHGTVKIDGDVEDVAGKTGEKQ